MKDEEEVRLMIIYRHGDSLKAHVEPVNTIATRTSARSLTAAIVEDWRSDLGLPSTATYELYIKVPADKVINSLNLDGLGTIALFPSEVEMGPIYSRTKKDK